MFQRLFLYLLLLQLAWCSYARHHRGGALHSYNYPVETAPLRLTKHAKQRLEERGYSYAERSAVVRGERSEACVDGGGNVVTVYPKGVACNFHG
jgi:hypothetical protein